MITLKQCTYLTYHHFSPESPISNGCIVCNMDDLLKSSRWVKGGGVGRLREVNQSFVYRLMEEKSPRSSYTKMNRKNKTILSI